MVATSLSFVAAQAVDAQVIANPTALTGTWYNPTTSGQGFVLDVSASRDGGGLVFGGWFTFRAADWFMDSSQELWLTLQGAYQNIQDPITLPVYFNQGGAFNAPPVTRPALVGNATLRFNDCTHAVLAYSLTSKAIFPLQQDQPTIGTIPLQRLGADNGCAQMATPAPSSRGFSGTWYNPATSGQGFVWEINPQTNGGLFFGGWFTYGNDGVSHWLTLQGAFAANATEADIPVYSAPSGLLFFDTPSKGSAPALSGTAHIKFTSCAKATLSYSLPALAPQEIALYRLTPTPTDCPLQ